MRGQYIEPITEELKEKFLDHIANGLTRPEAAEAVGGNARQYRSLCNPRSHRFDADFAEQYAALTEPDGEHHTALVERLRSAGIERAIRSSDRLLEKYSIIHDPDWAVHRPQAMQINFNKTEQLAVILPELSNEEILELRGRIESNMRQIGPPDIEADPK